MAHPSFLCFGGGFGHWQRLAELGGWPSIRTKALSRQSFPERCASTAALWFGQRYVEDQALEHLSLNHLSVEHSFHQPSIRPLTSAMILLCEHPAAGPVRKWKTALSFSKARSAVFCTGQSGCESAQSGRGLLRRTCQGHPRAALDTNDLRIRRVGAQHPVESYCQSARRRHLGHALRPCGGSGADTACEILHPSGRRVCAASTSNMRTKRLPCLLIAPSCCLPPELCSRGISPR